MKMSRLQFKDQLTLIEENLDRYLKSKKTDCILYAEDGSKFKIHKEVLGQTYFLRKILFSAKEHCCQIMEILLPCSKNELSHLVNFLYDGEIRCKEEKDSLKILENLNKLFGFDKSLDFQNNYEEPFQADESFCSSTDTEVLGDKEEALDNVVVIPIVNSINPIQRRRKIQKSGGAKKRLLIENDVAQTKSIPEKHHERAESNKNLSTKNVHDFVEEPIVKSINPIQRRRKVQKSGWAKRRLFVENEIGSATVLGEKTKVRKITPFSKDSAEYLKWKKARTQTKSIPEKPNERAEKNTNISTKNVYDFVEEPIVKSINTIQSWRKLQKSGGAKRRLFEGNNAASTTVLGDTSTPSSDDPIIVPLAQSRSQHVKKNPSEKSKKKPESKFKCDRSNDKVGENESENPEVLELRNKKKEKREEQYERWKNSAEYLEWKKTEKRPTSKRPNKKVQTDTNLSTKAEQEVGHSKKRKIVANRRLTSNEIENLLHQ